MGGLKQLLFLGSACFLGEFAEDGNGDREKMEANVGYAGDGTNETTTNSSNGNAGVEREIEVGWIRKSDVAIRVCAVPGKSERIEDLKIWMFCRAGYGRGRNCYTVKEVYEFLREEFSNDYQEVGKVNVSPSRDFVPNDPFSMDELFRFSLRLEERIYRAYVLGEENYRASLMGERNLNGGADKIK